MAAVGAALPVVFVLLRACLPPIGPRDPAPVVEPSDAGERSTAPGADPTATGSAGCAGCHPAETEAWRGSTHAAAEAPIGPTAPDGGALTAIGPDGVERRYEGSRTIGVTPVVQLLVPFPDGRLQVTQRAWDPTRSEWFDVFGDDRRPGEWGHWTGGGMTWNSQCASCHDTGVDKGWDADRGAYATAVDEVGVGCAACHGDRSAHPAGHAAGVAPASPAAAPDVDTCAACHARRAELTGRFAPGERFLDHFAPQLVDRSDAFWPDGQVREEDFEYTAFLGSKMGAAGVACVACHDPHSGAVRQAGDAMCLSCHAAMPGFVAHDHHAEGGAPPVGCVGCHMPVTTYMQRDPRHDHGFVVPDPATHVAFGIPDPCTRCHADRDAAWAVAAATAWYGDLGSDRRVRTEAIARGRAGDPGAIPGLTARLGSDRPAWRAASAAILGGFVDRPEVRDALIAALVDPDPHVRFAAIGALDAIAPDPAVDRAVTPLLADPVRSVRVQAARALRFRLRPTDPAAADYAAYLAHNADVPAGLHERGTWAIERGDAASAVRDLQRAVSLDPNGVVARDALAVALAGYGRPADAAAQLREAVKLAPDDAGIWFRLGLAEAGIQDLAAAEVALDRAVTLDPADPRAWYNLGLVRSQLSRGAPAIAALRTAVKLAPADPDTGYALASVLLQQGAAADARREAERVLTLAPDHAGAKAVLAAP
ncbi:MAG: tetratricopeptide repeat protein [Myxococcota bacterium]